MKQPEISCLVRLQGVCLEVIGGYINSNEDFDVEKAIIIDFLHDSVEDTDTTYEEIKENFGEDIALGVLSLTKNDTLPKKVKMIDSLNRIKQQNKEVAIVKLADRLFNLKDVPHQWDYDKIKMYKEEEIFILN